MMGYVSQVNQNDSYECVPFIGDIDWSIFD